MYKILLVDDEPEIIEFLRMYMEREDWEVRACTDGLTAVQWAEKEDFDLYLLDIMMPNLNGYLVCKTIRRHSTAPIFFMSAKVETTDKIFGLESGADDYITKPFDPLEVIARIKAAFRRMESMRPGPAPTEPKLTCRDLELDTRQVCLRQKGLAVELTALEYRLMEAFMGQPGRIFSGDQLYSAAWPDEVTPYDENALRVAISKLRGKIGADRITTVRGLGYRLEP